MDQLEQSLISAGVPAGLSAVIVAIMIAVDRYLRYRSETIGAKTTGESRERELLSADQQAFRSAILDQLSVMQKQVLELQEELNEAHECRIASERRYLHLEAQIKSCSQTCPTPCVPMSSEEAEDIDTLLSLKTKAQT